MPDPVFLSGSEIPDYLRGVELMSAGMQWQAMNGPCTITMDHLADAVRAFNDPHIQPPRIKLGHTSAVNGDHPNHDAFAEVGDAEPAFGVFTNLRLENDGATLVGDADNVPAWLAGAALSAYPNRSAEGDWNVVSAATDVQTNGGQRYSFVCTAVSLLGVYLPAITDLEDLQTVIVSGPTALTESKAPVAAATQPGVTLSVSYDTVWERSIEWLREHKPEWPYSWTRDIRVDPDECIVDDDEGHIWALPFTTDGANAITYGPDLTPKAPPQFPDANAPVAASRLVASFARPSKPSRKPAAAAATNAANGRPDPEGGTMDKTVREFLEGQGVEPDKATEAQIKAAEAYTAAEFPAPAETPVADGEQPEAEALETPEAEVVEAPEAERVPVAASADPIAAAERKAFADLSARVIDMQTRENARLAAETKTRRDDKVSAALTAGKITPAEREHYRGLIDIDETRTDALLSALPANRVPLEARAQVPGPESAEFAAGEPLPANVSLLTPDQRATLAARRA